MLLQPLPLLRLSGQQEVEHVARNQAQPAVVVLRPAPEVAARRWVLAVNRFQLPHRRWIARAGVWPMPQQRTLDRLLEGALGDLGTHEASSRTSILASDRRRDQGGAVFLEVVDGLVDFGDEGVDFGCFAVEVGGDGELFWRCRNSRLNRMDVLPVYARHRRLQSIDDKQRR